MKLDRRLISFALPARAWLAAAIAFGVGGGLAAYAAARALAAAIDGVFLGGGDLASAAPLLAFALAAAGIRALCAYGSETAGSVVALRAKAQARSALMAALWRRGPAYLRGERSGELVSLLSDGIEALDPYFREYLPQVALAAAVPLIMLAAVFPLDPLSGVVLLVTAPLIPLFMVLIGDRSEALTRAQFGALSRLSAYFLDAIQGLPTLKLFGRSREAVQRVAVVTEELRHTTMRVLRVTFLSALTLELLSTLSTAIVAVAIGLRLLAGQMEFEQALVVLILAPEFYLPLRSLGQRFHAGMAGVAAAERIARVLGDGRAASTPAEPRAIPEDGALGADIDYVAGLRSDSPGSQPALELRHVCFTYPGASQPALRDLSLAVPAGSTLAVAGPSGSGKSTLFALLLRFLEPDAGSILVDGIDLGRLHAADWRARVAWVPQRPHLFAGSVAENLRLARPGASDAALRHAADLAGASEFILRLPESFDTPIGERGARLSGGQAQRLALARAFLKDAPLLLLDEPAANVDPEQEDAIHAAIARHAPGRTTLFVTHSPVAMRGVQQVVVLVDGAIVEAGTPESLMRLPGFYRRLAQAGQAT